jgi:magnesium chelatase subunit I
MMEFALHGLAEFSQLSKHRLETGIQFKDLLGSMMNFGIGEEEEEGTGLN